MQVFSHVTVKFQVLVREFIINAKESCEQSNSGALLLVHDARLDHLAELLLCKVLQAVLGHEVLVDPLEQCQLFLHLPLLRRRLVHLCRLAVVLIPGRVSRLFGATEEVNLGCLWCIYLCAFGSVVVGFVGGVGRTFTDLSHVGHILLVPLFVHLICFR